MNFLIFNGFQLIFDWFQTFSSTVDMISKLSIEIWHVFIDCIAMIDLNSKISEPKIEKDDSMLIKTDYNFQVDSIA